MEALHRRDETDEQRRERERQNDLYRPRFEQTELFGGFRVEVTLDHPYWTHVELERRAPKLDTNEPSVEAFLDEYNAAADELYDLAGRLMRMIDPTAGETLVGAEPAPAPAAQAAPVDAVTEIKRYKELLDQGVITEEEFAAKRRQLMGI